MSKRERERKRNETRWGCWGVVSLKEIGMGTRFIIETPSISLTPI